MTPRMKNRRKIGWSVRRCMYYAATSGELDDHHDQQQRDDQAVGDVALEVGDADLDRGDDHQDHRDHHVLERRRVRPDLAGQQPRRGLEGVAELAVRDGLDLVLHLSRSFLRPSLDVLPTNWAAARGR